MGEKNDFPACLATLLLHRLMVGSLSEYPSQSARRLVRTSRLFERTAGPAEASRGFYERWEMRTDSKLEGHLLVGLDRRCRFKNKQTNTVENECLATTGFSSILLVLYILLRHFQSLMFSLIAWFVAKSEVLA